MPITEVLAGLSLILLVALCVELAELSARLRVAPMRHRDRLDAAILPAPRPALDRLGGVALAATAIWFLALPWAAGSGFPAGALLFFLAIFVVGVGMLSRLPVATVRYPLATFAPLAVVAGATAMT